MTAAIIVASGSSRRMGFDKLMADLESRPVLEHSVRAFAACPEIDAIVIVTDKARFGRLDLSGITQSVTRVSGGAERQDSVQNGLKALSPKYEWVAIHDGARPFVTAEAISETLQDAREFGAATLAHPVVETLKRADENGFVSESLCRENVWAMETPQCFEVTKLGEAYQYVQNHDLKVTDEVSVFQHIGWPVKLVHNPTSNSKITFPNDLPRAN
jgi:2-C-methyl-D-erythritol 4-phosphate cytidylyltransferase